MMLLCFLKCCVDGVASIFNIRRFCHRVGMHRTFAEEKNMRDSFTENDQQGYHLISYYPSQNILNGWASKIELKGVVVANWMLL